MGLFTRKRETVAAEVSNAFLIAGSFANQGAIARGVHRVEGHPTRGGGVVHAVEVELRAEPHNPHDKRAIAVLLRGKVVGHIPKERTNLFHPQIAEACGRTLVADATVMTIARELVVCIQA